MARMQYRSYPVHRYLEHLFRNPVLARAMHYPLDHRAYRRDEDIGDEVILDVWDAAAGRDVLEDPMMSARPSAMKSPVRFMGGVIAFSRKVETG